MNEKLQLKVDELELKYKNYQDENSEIESVVATYLSFLKEGNFNGLNDYLGTMQEVSVKNADTFAKLKIMSAGLSQKVDILKSQIYDLQATEGKSSEIKAKKSQISLLCAEKNEIKKKEIEFKIRKDLISEIIKSARTSMSNHKSLIA